MKKPTFPKTTLDEVASCLKYTGEAKTISDMQDAISSGALMSQAAEPKMLTKIQRLRAQVLINIVKADEIDKAINTGRP